MTTIGTAVLQIIPSLLGVTEAIEKQIDGKAVDIQIKPKVDQRATEQAAKQTRETVEKQTTQVKVEPKVDKRAAERAGKDLGEEMTKSVEKSSTGKDLAKVIVDGVADGVKDELRGGPLVDEFVDGLADGVKQGIDQGGFSKTILNTISDGLKSGDVGSTIKDAVLPGIRSIGTDLRTGAVDWSRGVADALRSGDIEGATSQISDSVLNTTNTIADIGATFGLQLDGVREFGTNSASALSDVAGKVQGVISTATNMKSTFADFGDFLEKTLPDKAGKGAAGIADKLGKFAIEIQLLYEIGKTNPLDPANGIPLPDTGQLPVDIRDPKWGGKIPRLDGKGNPIEPAPKSLDLPRGYGNGPHGKPPAKDPTGGLLGGPAGVVIGPDGKPIILPGRSSGGYTGNLPIDKVAGVVHGGEWVINALSTSKIQSAAPGLLEALNGYQGGGLVAGTSQLRKIIGERFGISNIGGYRPGGDGFNEHSTGRALDVMVGNNKAKGDSVKDFALSNASAIDLKWVIWRQHLYYPGGGGYDMPDRGSPTQNHMDHVHIFSGTGITNGLRGTLQGVGSAVTGRTPASSAPGAIDPASTDSTSAASPADVAPASSGSGGGISLASSISGLSGMGLSGLGSGVGKTSSGSDLSLFGEAASSAVSGQVSSALGVFGVNDSPGWLKGISTFVGGLSISDSSGKKIFDGSNIGGTVAGAGSLFGSAAPVSASAPVGPAPMPNGADHGAQAGRAPGPAGPTYHIRTATVEDAFVQAQQQEKVRLASKLDRY